MKLLPLKNKPGCDYIQIRNSRVGRRTMQHREYRYTYYVTGSDAEQWVRQQLESRVTMKETEDLFGKPTIIF